MAEGFKLIVPRLAEGQVEALAQLLVRGRRLQGRANTILGDNDVADRVHLRVENTQGRRVTPASAVARGGGFLRHLVAQVLPTAQSGRQTGARANRSDPRELAANHARRRLLIRPLEVDLLAERGTQRPLDVRAQSGRC